ncbi:MAG: hypothetical protein GY943_10120 [Chloroflexi bacterium]|nr:hypothetical protein [Chloroflexota bacterium]
MTAESFSEFKNSFSYGSRSDLNFKFLKGLSDEDAAHFFQGLLWKLGDAFEDGDYMRVVQHVIDGQVQAYDKDGYFTYDDAPFTKLSKPLSESRVILLTSSGHFIEGDDPEPFGEKNMTQKEAMRTIGKFLQEEPTLSEIPIGTPLDKLRVRHGGYDIRGAQEDANVALPISRLQEFDAENVIGEFVTPAYSFVGACAQMPLLKKTGPAWVEKFLGQKVDVAVLVPV